MSGGPERRSVRKVVGDVVHDDQLLVVGVERYDVWPSKPEVHERHFFQLAPLENDACALVGG